MKVTFNSSYLFDLYHTQTEHGKPKFPQGIVKGYVKKIDVVRRLNNSNELIQLKSLHFEKLKKEYKGYCSIRVNDQYRIIFKLLTDNHIEVVEVHDLNDYH